MLKLDTKQIRKGKPVGLPYQGSKKKISKQIVEIIKQNFGTDKVIYDVFGGGGAITAECIINGLDVHYNDKSPAITNMFCRVLECDRDWLKTLIISRDEFIAIRQKQDKTIDDELKLLINSFGNNRRTYLYGKNHGQIKYELAHQIIDIHDAFCNYKQTDAYQKVVVDSNLEQLQRLQQLGRLQQLERLQQLRQLKQPKQLKPTNLDYRTFSNVKGAIFYLDPPYENAHTAGYDDDDFDSQAFYDWAYQMSKDNIVLVSSYEISDSRFECVYHFEKAKGTFKGRKNSKTEKLFMVKQ